jgi:hypothetical protein
MERLVHVADMLDKYTGTNDHIDWEGLMSEFVGQWYHKEANLKKAATIARAFKNKPLVIFIYFNFLFL